MSPSNFHCNELACTLRGSLFDVHCSLMCWGLPNGQVRISARERPKLLRFFRFLLLLYSRSQPADHSPCTHNLQSGAYGLNTKWAKKINQPSRKARTKSKYSLRTIACQICLILPHPPSKSYSLIYAKVSSLKRGGIAWRTGSETAFDHIDLVLHIALVQCDPTSFPAQTAWVAVLGTTSTVQIIHGTQFSGI